jgi:serine/threonine protein kinase
LITEWLPSGNLFTFLSEPTHQLSAWETANMALDIAHGMEYLHMNKILHRDLKLHNLLLNQNKRVKIADFGSSIVLSEEKQKVRGNFGTFGFIAPEVYEEKEYAEKSDVFSYGICIWQIITKSASNPFRNEDDYYSKVTAEEFPASVKLACEKAGCTPALARIVRDCCNYIPENRPLFSDIVKSLEKAFPLHSYNTRSKQGVIAPSIEEQELL